MTQAEEIKERIKEHVDLMLTGSLTHWGLKNWLNELYNQGFRDGYASSTGVK